MLQSCQNCRSINAKAESFIRYPHLKHFYSRYSDDLLEHDYFMCEACSQFWRVDDCSYPADSGFFWTAISVELFLKWEAEYLPPTVDHSREGIIKWVNASDSSYNVGLF